MADQNPSRREFLQFSSIAGAALLMPIAVSCVGQKDSPQPPPGDGNKNGDSTSTDEDILGNIPLAKPGDWNPITYNKVRGNAGAIPESYLDAINGRDGDKKHLGKHLPYVVSVADLGEGKIAIMWGDESKGYAAHPNAGKSDENPTGHWYNWIRVRKATDEDAEELESKYSNWPTVDNADNGSLAAKEGDDPAAESGKNTVYVAELPSDVKPGDTVRIYAHCLTHGEYVDFLTVPA